MDKGGKVIAIAVGIGILVLILVALVQRSGKPKATPLPSVLHIDSEKPDVARPNVVIVRPDAGRETRRR